jgi:glyoxylase-like metal-dependent hydrolase (beta-lactamase superfamily II)
MVFIDTGTKSNPPIAHIEQVLKNHNVDHEKIAYIVLTHAHQDHFQNLPDLQKIAPNAKSVCHKNDLRTIRYPFLMDPTWFEGLYYNGLTKWGVYSYSAFYAVFSNFYFKTIQKVNKIEAYVKNEAVIKVGQEKIHIIPVQGHSQGHLCVLDGRKNLFLGDFVPFTPWVDPTEQGIDLIVASIKRILEFSTAQVKRGVRAHGDIRREDPQTWEIDTWENERRRFQFFLETIYETLDRIPKVIHGKECTIQELTSIFAPHYLRYSKLMRTIFIPPAITWGIAYALKLKKEGLISTIRKKGQYFWTA